MYKLFRFYNQHRRAILIILLIIAFFFIFLKTINQYVSNQNNIRIQLNNNSNENQLNNSVVSNQSAITGDLIDTDVLSNHTKIIEEFIEYCKNNDTNKAYNLISDDCKEMLYKTEEEFKNKYLNLVFKEKDKLYSIKNYYDNIYMIDITDNILSTGKKSNYHNQEFVSVVKENDEKKLNIGGFIGKRIIDKEKEENKIQIKLNNYFEFMDFSILDIEITNKNEGTILLSDVENIDGLYLQDNKSIHYGLYTHEYTKEQMKFLKGETKKLRLKFYSKYISSKRIDKLIFNQITLNYGDKIYENNVQISVDF